MLSVEQGTKGEASQAGCCLAKEGAATNVLFDSRAILASKSIRSAARAGFRGRRLVSNNHLWVLHEKPCDGVPLLLASRQPRRPFADSSTMPTCSSAPTANVWFLGDTRDIRDWKNAPLPQTTGQNVVQDAEMGNEIILLVNDSDKAR